MNKKEEEKLKAKARKISIAEGSAHGVMEGFGYNYITPFALALGAGSAHIGFLSSIPSLLGSLSRLYSSRLIEKFSRKKILIASVMLQTLMWIPLIFLGVAYFFFGLDSAIASILLIGIYTLLIILGAFGTPAWNSWMRDLTEKRTDSYFGKRNTIVGSVALVSMFIAAFILDGFGRKTFFGFGIIFFIALLGRSISIFLFKKQYEPKIRLHKGYYFSFKDFVKHMSYNNFGKFVLFSGVISFAVAIASPFFSVYMLNHLDFNYKTYMFVILSSAVVSLVSMPFWGKLGDKYGEVKLIRICGFLIFLVPLLWFLSAFLFTGYSLGLVAIYY